MTGGDTTLRDSYLVTAQSRWETGPVLKLRFSQQNNRDRERLRQEVNNRTWQASLDYRKNRHFLHYLLDSGTMENVVAGMTGDFRGHQFRWNAEGLLDAASPVQVHASYYFSHRTTSSVVSPDMGLLEFVVPEQGLYGFTDNPVFGALDPLSGLVDGDAQEPTDPPIDLGGAAIGHNLGADFGAQESIVSVYVYTDRPSGESVQWYAYGSDDNLNWTPVPGITAQSFNANVNRYEIVLEESRFRYFKLVNGGGNEVGQALVTELRFLRPVPETGRRVEAEYISSEHQLKTRLEAELSRRWSSALDLQGQFLVNHGRSGDRRRLNGGWSLDFRQTERLMHTLRADGYRQDRDGGADAEDELALTYALQWRPNDFWQSNLNLAHRTGWEGGHKNQIMRSAQAGSRARLIRGLSLNLGGNATRFDPVEGFVGRDSWGVRGGLDMQPVSSLSIGLGGRYLEAREDGEGLISARTAANLDATWRLTRRILVRGSINMNRDLARRFTYDLLASWSLRENLRVTVQHYELTEDGRATTVRRQASLNWDLTRRARFYLRLSQVDLSGGGGETVDSFQQGFRMSF